MKKIYVIISLLLVASIGFSQYANKVDARLQVPSKAKTLVKPTTTPVLKATQNAIFEESFEFTSEVLENGWTSIDNDGDGNDWFVYDIDGTQAHTGTYCMASASWNNVSSALTPDNYLISPAIDLSSTTGTIMLEWWIAAQDPAWFAEKYKVMISTTGSTVADFTNNVFEETLTTANWQAKNVDISSYAGETIYVAFVHYDVTDNFYIKLDDVSVFTNTSTDAELIGITAPNNDSGCGLTATEAVTVQIKNNGGAAITDFDVSYTIDGGTAVTETVTETIAPAATLDYTFATTADLSGIATYTIEASVALTDDQNADNDTHSIDITSGDATITIHALTDNMGGQSWQIINKLTNEVVAERTVAWQWNVEVTETICVIDANCYDVIVTDEDGNGMVDGAAYLEILYNDVQVAGSTTPDSWSTATLIAENLGSGCAAIDAKIESIEPIFSACELGMVDIIVNIKNAGTTDMTAYDVSYTINEGTPVVESLTEVITAGTVYQHTFATQADLSVPGTYTIGATVSIDGDVNTDNNAAESIQVENIAPAAIPYLNTFDTPETDFAGMIIENVNLDDGYWAVASGYGVEGSGALGYLYGTTAADDWVISTCIELIGGQEYTVKIDYAVMSDAYPEKLDIYFGTAQSSESMTLIGDIGTITNTEFETASYNFTPDADGSYYIGIHAYSDANMYYAFVDNLSVDVSTNLTEMNTSNISIYPNPANNVVTVANAENENIVVINMLGKVVANINNANANQTIDISNLSNGTYFIKVNSEVFKLNVIN